MVRIAGNRLEARNRRTAVTSARLRIRANYALSRGFGAVFTVMDRKVENRSKESAEADSGVNRRTK